MKRIIMMLSVAALLVVAMAVSAMPALAATPQNGWEQVVKACNASSTCYPGGENRGSYVKGCTQTVCGPDNKGVYGTGPGYGGEIQNLSGVPSQGHKSGQFT